MNDEFFKLNIAVILNGAQRNEESILMILPLNIRQKDKQTFKINA